MRAEIYELQCTVCEFKDSVLDGGNNYIYEGEEERRPALVNHCYCRECQEVRKVLDPFTIKHLGLSSQELSSLAERSEKKSFLGKLVNFKSKAQKSAEEKINKESNRLKYFQNNRYQSRCFHCSSFNIKNVELPSIFGNQKVLIGVTHKCGGQLNICHNGHLNLNGLSNIRFNENGIIDPGAAIDYCRKIANSAKIETILEEGVIAGFAIFIDEDPSLLNREFNHHLAKISFIRIIDRKINNGNYVDDRKQFSENYNAEFKREKEDNMNAPRMIVNNDEVFYRWIAK